MTRKVTEGGKELGQAIADARKARGLTQHDVAKVLRNQAWVSRVESGACRPTPNEFDELIRVLKPCRAHLDIIEKHRTPPPPSAGMNSPHDRRFLELRTLEPIAAKVRAFTCHRLPTQLQSEQYMLMQYREAGININETEILAEHRRRGLVFTGENPPVSTIVITISALLQMPGGRTELIKEQARYLLECTDRHRHLNLRVLPFRAKVAYVTCDMVILDFAHQQKQRVFLVPGVTTLEVKNPREATRYVAEWQRTHDAALDVDASRKFIHRLYENGWSPLLDDNSASV